MEGWLEHLRAVRGRTPATSDRYRRQLAGLARAIGGDLLGAAHADIERHIRDLYVAGASASTRAGLVSAARGFYEWLVARGVLEASPAARLQGPGRRYEEEAPHLTIPEVERLVFRGRPGTIPSRPLAARGRLIVAVSYVCGLRVSEPGRLRLEDVQWDEGGRVYSILVRRAKWADRDHRLWLAQPTVSRMLGAYLALRERAWPGSEWVFPAQRGGGGLSARRVGDVFHEEMAAAQIEPRGRRLTFHVLRHSVATHLVQRGMPEKGVALWLRHRDRRSTDRYVHVHDARLLRMWRRRDPLSRRGEAPPDVLALGRALVGDVAAALGSSGRVEI